MKNIARNLIVLAALVLPVTAAANGFDLPRGAWWEDDRLADFLALSDGQREEIRSRVYEHARRMADLNAEVRKAEIDLRQAVGSDDFDPQAVREAFAKFQDARHRLELERFEMLLGVRLVLTTEQWNRLQRARERLERMRDDRGEGRRPAAPPGR
jgi:Spy/CpxP family protein refolding chaperone